MVGDGGGKAGNDNIVLGSVPSGRLAGLISSSGIPSWIATCVELDKSGAKLLRRVGVIIMFRFASLANALRRSSFVATLRSTIRVLGESCVKQYMISSMPSSVSWLRSTYENLD